VIYLDAITHITPGPLPGDFNGDFLVDAADYVVWRNGLGTAYTQIDYETWRAHFGQTSASSSGPTNAMASPSAVAEPSSLFIFLIAAAICRPKRRAVKK